MSRKARPLPGATSPPIRAARRLGRRRIHYGGCAAALATALAAAAYTGAWPWLLVAFAPLAAALAATAQELRTCRSVLHGLQKRFADSDRELRSRTSRLSPLSQVRELRDELSRTQTLLATSLVDQARAAGRPLGERLPADLVALAVPALLDRGDALDAHALASGAHSLATLDRRTLRALVHALRKRGYLTKALEVAEAIPDPEQRDKLTIARLRGEIAVTSGRLALDLGAQPGGGDGGQAGKTPGFRPVPGRVLHLVGRSLPAHQTGYTLRTHYLAKAQRDAGLDPHVVTQMGVAHDGDDYPTEQFDGVTYHRLPGSRREREPLDRWLRAHAQRMAKLVRVVRPAVLHAASDFLNAQTALAVGRRFGIPVVYESRGFWEETWLSRKAAEYGWDLNRLDASYGLPDAYLWRREVEDCARREADRVVTLDEVMADRIAAGGVARERVMVVPNGVDVDGFPVLRRDPELAARLGIGEDTTVVGYISSLVEYEGIDTLISAYAELTESAPVPVALLVVGDGPVRDKLEQQARAHGLDGVHFTGRVPHDQVLGYYRLIDIFVVPRHPVEVCQLVTPLKPFEAFATGRTVLLSNVRALAAIANQSGAAELFEAGNPQSLATVLLGLLKDPARRQELAAAGARWVRTERTWTAHAQTYVRMYEELGAIATGELAIRRLSATAMDPAELRGRLAGREPIPFEALSSADAGGNPDQLISHGWRLDPHPVVDLDLPIDWTSLCGSDRSWNFRLHAWDFLGPVLRAYADTGERRYLDWCVARAASWARQFHDGDARGTMAWYDMALGLRGHRLAYLTEQAVLQGTDPDTVSTLLECVVRHQQEFFADRAFNPATNHGLYVALGQCALARRLCPLPGMDILGEQGRRRLATVARSQFTADGGHREHSPEYHRMLVGSFTGAIRAGLITDDEVRRRVGLAEQVLDWFIQPNGELVQVGDSHARPMRAAGGGRGGPERRLLVLPETGYAIVRSAGSYLFLAAGFHSRTHKHADDAALTWFDRGGEILIDAGRYGYVDPLPKDSPLRQQGFFYGAPERQYVESTRAHNTVEVDGRDQHRRGRRPYGSAITQAEERDGHFRLLAEVDHGHWHHRREVVLRPGRWLYVVDRLRAQDGASHDYRVWWNLPHERTVRATDGGRLRAGLADADTLWILELAGSELIAPVAGQRDPMRGWRSKRDLELTPAWSAGFEAVGAGEYEFRTLLWLGNQPPTGPPDHPFR